MLISPPFLPPRGANQTDDEWIDNAMPGGSPGDGAYPVSRNLGWHGGMHLNTATAEPVRAIADGTVVYVRPPTPIIPILSSDPDYLLNYGGRGWTSDGVVVIRHDTEIGADAQGRATQVRFFSVYMHLHTIAATVKQNQPIYRKNEIGQAGYIYGQPGRIHFEIICDDANLQRLVDRTQGEMNTAVDGRTDAIYGEMYFHLPAGTVILDRPPTPIHAAATAPPVHTTMQALAIGLRYAGGDGAANQHGHAYLTTYQLDGGTVGSVLVEPDAEYNLYQTATDLSNAFPANLRPAPSAVYELLRFGRVIGPDALNPVDVPHWRQIRYPGGQGWVNLNAANVRKFSDADFPHWKRWTLIDDSADRDSRCDSATIRGWLDVNKDGKVNPVEATARLGDDSIAPKLARVIGRFPTEWDAGTIETRWGWLKTKTEENPEPLSNDDFTRLSKHINTLCFWRQADLGIPASHWHFQPREFIKHFRKCGWLSVNEMAQCMPRQNRHLVGSAFTQQTVASWDEALRRSQRWFQHLNVAARKYVIPCNKQRLAHFLSQCIEESGYLQLVIEGGGENASYAPWYGRGLIQLTHLQNYREYGTFRGWSAQTGINPVYAQLGWDPERRIARSDFACADSAGFYWVCTSINAIATHMNSPADRGITPADVLAVSRGINGNVTVERVNGLDIRIQLAIYLKYALMEELLPAGNPPAESITFTWRNRSRPRPFTPVRHMLNVILSPQRP